MKCKKGDIAQLSMLLNRASLYNRAPYAVLYIEPRLCGVLADLLHKALLEGKIEIEEDKYNEETNI